MDRRTMPMRKRSDASTDRPPSCVHQYHRHRAAAPAVGGGGETAEGNEAGGGRGSGREGAAATGAAAAALELLGERVLAWTSGRAAESDSVI